RDGCVVQGRPLLARLERLYQEVVRFFQPGGDAVDVDIGSTGPLDVGQLGQQRRDPGPDLVWFGTHTAFTLVDRATSAGTTAPTPSWRCSPPRRSQTAGRSARSS